MAEEIVSCICAGEVCTEDYDVVHFGWKRGIIECEIFDNESGEGLELEVELKGMDCQDEYTFSSGSVYIQYRLIVLYSRSYAQCF